MISAIAAPIPGLPKSAATVTTPLFGTTKSEATAVATLLAVIK
jgi:hypothetical protein